MEFERGRYQKQARGLGPQGDSGKIAVGRELIAVEVPFDAQPVIEGLQGKLQVGGGFQFQDGQAAGALDGQQVEDAAVAAGEGRHLVVDRRGQ